jgi:hypothetical protein
MFVTAGVWKPSQQKTLNVVFHDACRLTTVQPSFCKLSLNAPVRVSATGSFSAEKIDTPTPRMTMPPFHRAK